MRNSFFALIVCSFFMAGCGGNHEADSVEQSRVQKQQQIYNTGQPAPTFEWSLSRQLWGDFYLAANKAVTTWSYITPQNSSQVLFETPSQGYPLPFNTQLTNPLQVVWDETHGNGVIAQAEPNGLFSSPSTDGTIVFAANHDGTLSPIYTELKVTTFPFPVRWDKDHWVRIEGKEPSIKLSPERRK